MGLKRTQSVKVADVVIPQRLLSTTKQNNEWNRRRWGQAVLYHERHAPDAIHRHQKSSSVDSSSSPRERASSVGRVGRPRKNSEPITYQEASSVQRYNGDSSRPKSVAVTESFISLYENEEHDTHSKRWSDECSDTSDDTSRPHDQIPQRRGTVKGIVHAIVPDAVQQKARNVADRVRRNSIYETYEMAKARGKELERERWVQIVFEYSIYLLLIAFIYLVLIGMPLWEGAVYWMYWVVQKKFVLQGGWSITMGIALFYAFSPLLILFEKEPPVVERPADFDRTTLPGVARTALLIPCYKSENIIGPTLEAALKVFPPSHIFVIANGNSETPLDNTEEVCRQYNINHIWSPVGSKIVAQYVGCYAAKRFKNVLLIDDDCALPPNFPVVSDRLVGKVKSIGYTIKSVGPGSSKGTWCQQAQDLEYKISGLQRALAGKIGSATFPHGAISLWNRRFLIDTFKHHPGFSVSEDWFFGHSSRCLGGRIKMCTSVFVETETPSAIFFSSGGSRGGFGEMTVFKQRFLRWNFFFVNGMWYNLAYFIASWKLGWWEFGTKLFVLQEVYETVLYLLTPFLLPISFLIQPSFCGYLLLATVGMYLINVLIFNEVHLRMRNERVGWTILLVYYMPYKLVLTFINVGSCYWSLYKYARYFAKRHPKVIEDENAVGVVMHLEEEIRPEKMTDENGNDDGARGRRMFVTAPKDPRASMIANDQWTVLPSAGPGNRGRMSFVVGAADYISPSPRQPEPTYSPQASHRGADLAITESPRSSYSDDSFMMLPEKKGRRSKTVWSQSPV